MQVLNSSVARPWKLEQNTSGQASRQALTASRLWKLEQNNMTKKGPFFGPQNVRKSRRAKMGLPSTLTCCSKLESENKFKLSNFHFGRPKEPTPPSAQKPKEKHLVLETSWGPFSNRRRLRKRNLPICSTRWINFDALQGRPQLRFQKSYQAAQSFQITG